MLALALPIIGGMVSQNLLNLADAWMVGALGPAALAACGLANFVNFMAVASIAGISTAVQTIAARRVGEGRTHETAVPLNGGLLIALCIGVPLSAVLIVAAPWIMHGLSNDPEVARLGTGYLQWRLVAVAAVGMNFSFRGYWTAIKKARLYMLTLIDMHILNIAFSYSLIHGLFGLPAMGINGAGLGTALSIIIGTGIYFWMAHRHADEGGFLHRLPTREEFRSLTRLGIPTAIQQFLFAGGFTALFWIVGRVGTDELAVANVLVTITLTVILPGIGFGIAATTLCSQSLGRNDVDDAQRWAWDVYKVGLWLFAPLAAVMIVFTDPILTLFVREPHLVAIGHLPLQLVGISIVFDVLGLIMMQALLGVGAAHFVMKVAIVTQWLLFLPLAYLIGPVWGYGLTAIWLATGGYRLLQAVIFTTAWQRRGWVHHQI